MGEWLWRCGSIRCRAMDETSNRWIATKLAPTLNSSRTAASLLLQVLFALRNNSDDVNECRLENASPVFSSSSCPFFSYILPMTCVVFFSPGIQKVCQGELRDTSEFRGTGKRSENVLQQACPSRNAQRRAEDLRPQGLPGYSGLLAPAEP